MTAQPRGLGLLAAGGAVWLAMFALVFSLGSAVGAWPAAPEGGFGGVDLSAGLLFGVVLLAALLAPRSRAPLG